MLVAIVAAAVPLRGAGWQAGADAAHAAQPGVRAAVGRAARACAIGAASQGKFHRLAALIMVGGAGLVTA